LDKGAIFSQFKKTGQHSTEDSMFGDICRRWYFNNAANGRLNIFRCTSKACVSYGHAIPLLSNWRSIWLKVIWSCFWELYWIINLCLITAATSSKTRNKFPLQSCEICFCIATRFYYS
jgi:hypothetical protein